MKKPIHPTNAPHVEHKGFRFEVVSPIEFNHRHNMMEDFALLHEEDARDAYCKLEGAFIDNFLFNTNADDFIELMNEPEMSETVTSDSFELLCICLYDTSCFVAVPRQIEVN